MHQAYLLLGSNQGNRVQYLDQAILALSSIGTVSNQSARYETEAWGLTDQPAFLNQAICLITDLPPFSLLDAILTIEKELGRERKQRYGPRTIDIDILLFENEVLDAERLTLPHPELPNRRFALIPLAEIAPNQIHPKQNKSIEELLQSCPDPLQVTRVN